MRRKKGYDWERFVFRFFGVCLGIIFAAYVSVGPKWICRSLANLRAQERPTITATWDGDTLVVTASPGGLYLVGAGRLETYIGSGRVELPATGSNADTAPAGRTIILKDWATGDVIARLPVPAVSGRVYLPLVSNSQAPAPPPVWRVILPLVARA